MACTGPGAMVGKPANVAVGPVQSIVLIRSPASVRSRDDCFPRPPPEQRPPPTRSLCEERAHRHPPNKDDRFRPIAIVISVPIGRALWPRLRSRARCRLRRRSWSEAATMSRPTPPSHAAATGQTRAPDPRRTTCPGAVHADSEGCSAFGQVGRPAPRPATGAFTSRRRSLLPSRGTRGADRAYRSPVPAARSAPGSHGTATAIVRAGAVRSSPRREGSPHGENDASCRGQCKPSFSSRAVSASVLGSSRSRSGPDRTVAQGTVADVEDGSRHPGD
jgi:hypothetical protein